ncbi:unnamed protein product [Arabidopsis arenosa]|uniref:PGG domain-containing protein n=1 Tax=Arabidopsis arenosa TaxID=38785 RepID=A0A8S2B813_ARAAE|nr:unnamed protein product [Arabidopsis arenosa]
MIERIRNHRYRFCGLDIIHNEREQLKNITTILQYLGGISAVGILNPSGGLDQNGHVRFRHKACYYVYFGCAEFAFLGSLVGAVYLTVNVSRDAARIRRMLRNGFIILSIVGFFFLTAFTAGVWTIVPILEEKSVSFVPIGATVAALLKMAVSIVVWCLRL